MKIAAGAARGLQYLHDRMTPPVIYRDLKCSNILLGEDYQPKLSDFGLAKVGPSGDKTHVSTRVMGTYGYCAPDYAMTGQLTFKSDIYSFGVVLLELITGRKAIDNTKTRKDQNLVGWVCSVSWLCLIIIFTGKQHSFFHGFFNRHDRCSKTGGTSRKWLIHCFRDNTRLEDFTKH